MSSPEVISLSSNHFQVNINYEDSCHSTGTLMSHFLPLPKSVMDFYVEIPNTNVQGDVKMCLKC